jgi:hypothetical protein
VRGLQHGKFFSVSFINCSSASVTFSDRWIHTFFSFLQILCWSFYDSSPEYHPSES